MASAAIIRPWRTNLRPRTRNNLTKSMLTSNLSTNLSTSNWANTLMKVILCLFSRDYLTSDQACKDGEAYSPTSPTSSSSSSESNSNEGDSQSVDRKRKLQLSRRDDAEGDDSNGVKQARHKPKSDKNSKLLACPYFKRYPERFCKSPVCVGPGWPTVYRLKEHLFRKHAPPRFQCVRCLKTFDSNTDLTKHQREEERCEKKDPVDTVGQFTSEQEDLLRQRTKAPLNKTEEQKWAEIYKILFADRGDVIPSPYYDYDYTCYNKSMHEGFMSFFQREFPSQLQRRLRTIPHLESDTMNSIISSCARIPNDIIKRWQPFPTSPSHYSLDINNTETVPSTDSGPSFEGIAHDQNNQNSGSLDFLADPYSYYDDFFSFNQPLDNGDVITPVNFEGWTEQNEDTSTQNSRLASNI